MRSMIPQAGRRYESSSLMITAHPEVLIYLTYLDRMGNEQTRLLAPGLYPIFTTALIRWAASDGTISTEFSTNGVEISVLTRS